MMSSTLRRTSISSALAGPSHSAPENHEVFVRTYWPSEMFCSTVMWGNSSMFWNVRAMPRAATLSGRRPTMLSPRHRTSPDCGL